MAIVSGTNLRIFVGTEEIGRATECSLSTERDLPDSSNKDSLGWAEHILGQKSWSMSSTAFLDFVPDGTDENFDSLLTTQFGTAQITIKFGVATGATVTGATEYSGTASIASMSLTAPNEDTNTFDIEFTGSGPLTSTPVV